MRVFRAKGATLATCATIMNLRVVTFNVLAPSLRVCEPLNKLPWKDRQRDCCAAIHEIDADIVALQEWDFYTDGFSDLYMESFKNKYEIFTCPRPGGKKEGLGLMLRKDCFEGIMIDRLPLLPLSCHRAAIMARMRHVESGRLVSVLNTHLTVAHTGNTWDIPKNRPLQMEQILNFIFAMTPENTVKLLCGDLNADHLEIFPPKQSEGCPAYTVEQVAAPLHMAFEAGFSSALDDSPDRGEGRAISHVSSYGTGHDGCVDYIFYNSRGRKGKIEDPYIVQQKKDAQNDRTDKTSKAQKNTVISLLDAHLYPRNISASTPWSTKTAWGGGVKGMLSDHRPVVADFALAVTPERTEQLQRAGRRSPILSARSVLLALLAAAAAAAFRYR